MRRLVGDPSAAAVGAVSSSLSGAARDVVQARDISGGVHFHTAEAQAMPAPRQLPADIRGFVGRAAELDRLLSLTDEPGAGPVVLVGTAGVGKSALAVHFAHRVRTRFPDGQLFVNLRGYDSGPPLTPGAALERFLRALGVPPPAIPPELEERAELYRSLLADRRVLVLLDNAATPGQLRPLLPGEPSCLVLATSRGRLSALTAREGARRITLGLLSESDAVGLIQAVTEGYRDDDEGQVTQLAKLCARLPLALRIAAERAAARPLMPLGELIGDLRAHSSLWQALSSEDEGEADAVRTVFAWSYRALPPAAARAFRLLGVHPGPDVGPGAAAALLDTPADTARGLLDALAGAHLLEQTGAARYQFHDLLRAYATDLATEEDAAERHTALRRVSAWYLSAARDARSVAQSGSPSDPARDSRPQDPADWYRLERANLLALSPALAEARLDETAWQLANALEPLQDCYGAAQDGLESSRIGLEAARRLGDQRAEARMLQLLGYWHAALGEFSHAADHHRDALQLYASLGESAGAIEAANGIGIVHLRTGDLTGAAERLSQALTAARAAEHPAWIAMILNNLAYARLEQGHITEALALAEQALAAHDAAGTEGPARLEVLATLARAHRENGDPRCAEHALDTALQAMAGGQRHHGVEVDLQLERAALLLAQGQHDQALEAYWQCEQLQRTVGDRRREAYALTGSAHALIALGRVREAVDFYRRSLIVRRALPDSFRIAEAESDLADALDSAEDAEVAQLRTDALERLESIISPRADTLRRRILEGRDKRRA